jgi:UDP:flavonoid glycosyltransferase YjiC (YdhE family)
MLLLPHQFEQEMIARRVKELGIGMKMNIKKITPGKLYINANQVISDSKYKNQALKFKSIFSREEKSSHVKAADEIIPYVMQ